MLESACGDAIVGLMIVIDLVLIAGIVQLVSRCRSHFRSQTGPRPAIEPGTVISGCVGQLISVAVAEGC